MILHNISLVLVIMEVCVDKEGPKDQKTKVARILGHSCPGCYPGEGPLWF